MPSTGHVRFEAAPPGGTLVPTSSRLLAGDVPFQTLDETSVWPVSGRAAIRKAVEPDGDQDEQRPDPAAGGEDVQAVGGDGDRGRSRNRRRVERAMSMASVVLPVPGGPQSTTDSGASPSTSRRSGAPLASRWR